MVEIHNFFAFGAASLSGFLSLVPFDYTCYNEVNLNLINFHFVILFGFSRAMIIVLVIGLVIACLPCICVAIYNIQHERHRQEQTKTNLIKDIFKTQFNKLLFPEVEECSICLNAFDENS